ncbi:MAG: hypothetical protein HY909_30620 [Deltaproteobacteria bacterium]|nr:hypothetical protein [Deltaproteobacteria bacterium]
MRPFLRHCTLTLSVASLSCAPEFSTARVPVPQGTVGEEVFRVLCERVDVGENPTDVAFERARVPCTRGLTMDQSPPPGVGPKVTALARLRADVVGALDQTFTRELQTPADRLLVQLLPLYGPDGSGRNTLRLGDGGVAPIEGFPSDFNPLTDCAGSMPRRDCSAGMLPLTTRSVVSLLDGFNRNAPFLRAMSRFSQRQGYRPPSVAFGLLRPVLGYSRLDDLLDTILRMFRDPLPATAASPAIPAGPGNGHFNTLLATLRGEMATAGPSMDTRAGTTLDATLDLLFRTDPELRLGRPLDLVRRDPRGMARVATERGVVPAPFADESPRDGLADVRDGAFVRGATRLTPPSPFPARDAPSGARDAGGRAMNGASAMYQYVDLDQSVLVATARQLTPLLSAREPRRVPLLQFLHASVPLFGGRRPATRDYGGGGRVAYQQFTAEQAPMVDLVHATGQLLASDDIVPILNTTRGLLAPEREALTARLLGALLGVDEIADRHPEATIAATSNIWDDTMDVLREVSQEPGLLEDILAAVASDPGAAARLGQAYANYATFKDSIEPDWSQRGYPLRNNVMTQRVDRSRADTRDNRSAFQRLGHLIDDLDGARLCSKRGARVRVEGIPLIGGVTLATANDECEIFQVPDAAAFYVRAIDRRAQIDMHIPGLSGLLLDGVRSLFPGLPVDRLMDSLIEAQSCIPGFTSSPTTFAIDRMVFRPDNPPACRTANFLNALIDPVTDRHGQPVRERHQGTIFVWELFNFYDAVRPIAHAFVLHDRETCKPGDRRAPGANLCADSRNITNFDPSRGSRLFVKLLGSLHRHWASDRAGDYQRTNPSGPSYSTGDGAVRYEPIVAEALQGDLLPALAAVSAALPGIPAGGGLRGDQAIAELVRNLVDPAVLPVTYRSGASSTVRSDNTTPVPRASLYYLFADAFARMDTIFAVDLARKSDWEASRSDLVDRFVTISGSGTSSRFQNRTLPPLGRLLVSWLQDRVSAHRAAGDLAPWGRGLGGRFAATAQGPVFAGALDLTEDLYNDASARGHLTAFLQHMLSETGDNRAPSPFAVTITGAADLLQVMRADEDVDPVLRAVAPAFVPSTGTVPVSLRFLDRARSYDTDRVLLRALANMVQRPSGDPNAQEPLAAIADAISDTHRVEPGTRGALSPEDVLAVLVNLQEFLADRSRGLEQFYYIVQHRRLPQ